MSEKKKVFDQSIYSHALYFDPINQQRMLTGRILIRYTMSLPAD